MDSHYSYDLRSMEGGIDYALDFPLFKGVPKEHVVAITTPLGKVNSIGRS